MGKRSNMRCHGASFLETMYADTLPELSRIRLTRYFAAARSSGARETAFADANISSSHSKPNDDAPSSDDDTVVAAGGATITGGAGGRRVAAGGAAITGGAGGESQTGVCVY